MSDNLITPIFTIIGIIIGSLIPSAMKFMEIKVAYSRVKKEKHEEITRKMLTEYIPKLDHALFLATNYLNYKDAGVANHNSATTTSEKLFSVEKFYNDEIKHIYPLEMHSKITEFHLEFYFICFDIDIDNFADNSTNVSIAESIEKCHKILHEITKHIDKNYI